MSRHLKNIVMSGLKNLISSYVPSPAVSIHPAKQKKFYFFLHMSKKSSTFARFLTKVERIKSKEESIYEKSVIYSMCRRADGRAGGL